MYFSSADVLKMSHGFYVHTISQWGPMLAVHLFCASQNKETYTGLE